jgi:hypothetical protein
MVGHLGKSIPKTHELQKRGSSGGESDCIAGDAGRPVRAWVAQLVERVLGKDEVTGSIPVPGSRLQAGEARRGV